MIDSKKTLRNIIIGAGLGLIISSLLVFVKVSIHNKFPRNTIVAEINISSKTVNEAKEIIEKKKNEYFEKTIDVEVDGKIVKITTKDLGVEIFIEETLKTINKLNAANIEIYKYIFSSKETKTNVSLITNIDYEELLSKIEKEFGLKELAPVSANFYFEGRVLKISDEKSGLVLNKEKLIRDIKEDAERMLTNKITLKLEKKDAEITKEQLELEKAEIEEMLRFKFTLIDPIYSDNWTTSLIEHLDWVVFAEQDKSEGIREIVKSIMNEEEEKKITIEINRDNLDLFINEEISKWLDVEVEDVNIYKNEEGEVVIEGNGSNGKKIQRNSLKKGIEMAVENRIKTIPISVIDIEPEVTISKALQEIGIVERIGVGHTSYYRSPTNRIFNIKAGAEKFNGHLVAPGEVFSFNTTLGPVDGANGYRKELVIKSDGTKPEYGGGICQVSTTVYRAILFSGLPIVERYPHSYAVSYYSQVKGHGLDATIYLGGANLKFENDTGEHILIQTYTKGDYELYVVFYGTSDGRSVEMEGPYLSNYRSPPATQTIETDTLAPGERKQSETAHTGFTALWYRYITTPEGERIVEEIVSVYRAMPAKILVGIDDTN